MLVKLALFKLFLDTKHLAQGFEKEAG